MDLHWFVGIASGIWAFVRIAFRVLRGAGKRGVPILLRGDGFVYFTLEGSQAIVDLIHATGESSVRGVGFVVAGEAGTDDVEQLGVVVGGWLGEADVEGRVGAVGDGRHDLGLAGVGGRHTVDGAVAEITVVILLSKLN